MRAPTTTRGKPDSFNPGAIAIESSSEKATGRSRTCLRSTASGIGGPPAGRAEKKTPASGGGFFLRLGEKLVVALGALLLPPRPLCSFPFGGVPPAPPPTPPPT